jgi:gamma-glutamylcyclotransferase
MTAHYFAYASNMSADVMARLCPGHRTLGIAELADHRLAFTRRSVRSGTGVADIVPAAARSVWGVLYGLDDAMLAAIDEKEGNGWAYRRSTVHVRPTGGRDAQVAQTYSVIAPERAEVRPSRDYLHRMLDAARERELPEEYLATLAAMWEPL